MWMYDDTDDVNVEKTILWDASDVNPADLAPIQLGAWQISSPYDAVYDFIKDDGTYVIGGPTSDAIIQTVLTLPVTMNAPTLFIDRFYNYLDHPPMEIQIGDGEITQTITSNVLPLRDYRRGIWADLTPWQNRPITIRLIPQLEDGWFAWEILTITIGSWRTPLVSMVAPLAIDGAVTETLSITGSNFLTGVQVTVGEQAVATTRMSSTQLEVVVPAGLGEGLYPIWVTNEGGIALFSGKLRVGTPFYFPWSTAYWSSR